MKSGIRYWRSSIFTRFIIIFLVFITPVYILGLSIYSWGLRMIEDEIIFSMTSQLEYFVNSLELEVKRLKALQYECLYDENLLFLANASQIMSDFEKTQALNRLQHRLDIMKNSSMYIKDVYAYIPSIQRTISAMNGVTEEFSQLVQISNIKPDDSDSQIIYWKNKMFLSVRFPTSSYFLKAQPRFILLVELSNNSFIDSLLSFINHKQSGSMLINLRQNYILTTEQKNDITDQILKTILMQKSNDVNMTTTSKIGEKAYLVLNKKSEFLNIEFITYTPLEQVYERIRKYQLLFVGFSIVSVIIMALFSFSTHRMIHKPLLKLVNSFKQLQKDQLIKVKSL